MSDMSASKPRFMHPLEVAHELGVKSRGAVYNLVEAGELVGVTVGPTGRGMRVTRKSFEAYCDRIEEEGRRRFRVA